MSSKKYLTYKEYTTYGGTMEEADFNSAEFDARKCIDYVTVSRVQAMAKVPEAVKQCMYTLVKLQSKYSADALADNGALVNSFDTDGYSESYGGASEQISAARKAMYAKIREMLYGEFDDNGTPLLYRGLDA